MRRDGGRGDDDRAEDDGQQDEGQEEHERDHQGRGVDHGVEVVDVLRARAADEHLCLRPRERLRDELRAELAHGVGGLGRRRIALDLHGQHRDLAVRRAHDLAVAEAGIGRETGRGALQAPSRRPRRMAFETTISAGSVVVPGKSRSSATKPCFETKRSGSVETPPVPMSIRNTGRASATSSPADEREAEPGPAQDATHDRAPEPPFRVRCLERAASDDGDAQGVDLVAEQAEDGRQERERRDHGDDADEDRPTARLRMIEFGTSSIPNIATTKTLPANSTARLAVAPEASIAASSSLPWPRSSR